MFLDDPHDGGYDGKDEPAVDGDSERIPEAVLLVCHVGSQGVISEEGQADSSCNAFFDRLSSLPESHKRLVLTFPDDHGRPGLTSHHGVCGTIGGSDAYDWGFCWRVWDAMADGGGPGRRPHRGGAAPARPPRCRRVERRHPDHLPDGGTTRAPVRP